MPHTLPAAATALLLIDLQQALFQPTPRPYEADAVVQRVNSLAARARAAGVPVVWVQHETTPGHRLTHGSPGWALADGLQTVDTDVAIRKTTPDSFLRTGLADWLALRGITQLVVAGYASEFCVDTTIRRAAGLGLAVTLAADAHTTHDKPHASAALICAHHNASLVDLTSFGVPITAVASDAITFAASPTQADHWVHTAAQLAALYGQPSDAALRKESGTLTAPYRALLEASPFLVLTTSGPDGLDASPRGNPAPAVVVQDDRILLLADRSALPTAGQMLTAATGGSFDGAAYDAALPARQRDSLY